jgi:DNA invertase Pin-like site-specific DNA recombinase
MGKSPKPPLPGNPPLFVGYARVSTAEQNLDLQTDALLKAGVHPDHIHTEYVSGAAKRRPSLDMAIKDLRPGDTLVVWRLDRLARSMRDLYSRLDDIFAAGAAFKSVTESFDFNTAIGKLYLAIAGAFAEFERQLISQRTKAGMQARKDRGHTLGRSPTMDDKMQAATFAMLKAGRSVAYTAGKQKVSKATIYNYFRITRKNGKVVITKRET